MQAQAIATVNDFLNTRKQTKLEQEAKNPAEIDDIKRQKILTDHLPFNWFEYVADNANQVSLQVTHVAKLTHSSSKASNISYISEQQDYLYLLTTQTSHSPYTDSAYTNAVAAPVADFLSVMVNDISLGELFVQNPQWFIGFANQKQDILDQWHTQISEAYQAKSLSSHVLAKQVYFPVNQDYHLLSPMTSSGLVQLLHEHIDNSREHQKSANKGTYTQNQYSVYPRLGVLNITKSNHQNASKLNSKRGGRQYLLCAEPPQWQPSVRMPKTSFFNDCAHFSCEEDIQKIQKFFKVMKDKKLDLNHHNRQALVRRAGFAAEKVLLLAAHYYAEQTPGWLQDSNLKLHQQYWLDPYREDENFQLARNTTDWEVFICTDFSLWLNQKIGSKDDKTAKLWRESMLPILRKFSALTELKEIE